LEGFHAGCRFRLNTDPVVPVDVERGIDRPVGNLTSRIFAMIASISSTRKICPADAIARWQFVNHLVGVCADQLAGHVAVVHVGQVRLDLPGSKSFTYSEMTASSKPATRRACWARSSARTSPPDPEECPAGPGPPRCARSSARCRCGGYHAPTGRVGLLIAEALGHFRVQGTMHTRDGATEVERLASVGVAAWCGSRGSVGRWDEVSRWWWYEHVGSCPPAGGTRASRGAVRAGQIDGGGRIRVAGVGEVGAGVAPAVRRASCPPSTWRSRERFWTTARAGTAGPISGGPWPGWPR
jgi:hypothetical protein